MKGEEGVDYTVTKGKIGDSRVANINKIKQDMRAETNALKIREPAVGKYYEDYLFKRNDMDEALELNCDIEKVVKYYPGSPKGPNPEDDPEHYSEWFIRNQPDDLIYGKGNIPDYKDIGAKWKFVWSKKVLDEDAMQVQDMDNITNFVEQDQLYQMQNYQGIGEFDIADRTKYDHN